MSPGWAPPRRPAELRGGSGTPGGGEPCRRRYRGGDAGAVQSPRPHTRASMPLIAAGVGAVVYALDDPEPGGGRWSAAVARCRCGGDRRSARPDDRRRNLARMAAQTAHRAAARHLEVPPKHGGRAASTPTVPPVDHQPGGPRGRAPTAAADAIIVGTGTVFTTTPVHRPTSTGRRLRRRQARGEHLLLRTAIRWRWRGTARTPTCCSRRPDPGRGFCAPGGAPGAICVAPRILPGGPVTAVDDVGLVTRSPRRCGTTTMQRIAGCAV